jgi:hypothetical protein
MERKGCKRFATTEAEIEEKKTIYIVSLKM